MNDENCAITQMLIIKLFEKLSIATTLHRQCAISECTLDISRMLVATVSLLLRDSVHILSSLL